jgi:hypothetical protein
MEVNLLSALIQGAETSILSQVNSATATQPGGGGAAQSGANLLAQQPGAGALTQAGNGAAAQPGLSGQAGGLTNPGQTGLSLSGQPGGLSTSVPALVASGQPAANIPTPPAFNTTIAQHGPSVLTPTGPSVATQSGGSGSEDVYYGSDAPTSASLLNQSGVGAYVQLLSAFSTGEQSSKSAEGLTNNLVDASAALKAGYNEVLSRLPAPLQQKDWGFSVSNGSLVFTGGKDELSPQDLSDLQKAFANSNVTTMARQVSVALAAIEQRVKSDADSSSLAWGRFETDDTNSGDSINLRSYVTATVPGGKYDPGAAEAAQSLLVPSTFGGMYLRDLISARPNFLKEDGSATTDAVDEDFESPSESVDISTLEGQCSCGEVHFTVENDFEYAFYCHCSRCRLRTGSAFAAIAGIGVNKVQITAGRESVAIEGECSEGYGARCSRCHAFLFAAVRNRQYMHVSLGVLGGTPNRVPDHHIYVGSKAPWYRITDSLPQYDELP